MMTPRVYTKLISFVFIVISLTLTVEIARAHEGVDEHILALTAKIKRDPKNASLYLQRGELYRLHRNWNRAAADFDRASRLQPTLTVVDFARGVMLFESGRYPRAKVVLDRFLVKEPGHVEGLITRARVQSKIGARLEAAHDLDR